MTVDFWLKQNFNFFKFSQDSFHNNKSIREPQKFVFFHPLLPPTNKIHVSFK